MGRGGARFSRRLESRGAARRWETTGTEEGGVFGTAGWWW